MALSFTAIAEELPSKDNGEEKPLARCEIREAGFWAKGRCKKVLAAYAQYKQLKESKAEKYIISDIKPVFD